MAGVSSRRFLHSSVADVQGHHTDLLTDLARRFNLSFSAFGKDVEVGSGPKYGGLELSNAWGSGLEPAPVSPFGEHAEPYQLLAGTIRATYQSRLGVENATESKDEIIVAPGVLAGNTGP